MDHIHSLNPHKNIDSIEFLAYSESEYHLLPPSSLPLFFLLYRISCSLGWFPTPCLAKGGLRLLTPFPSSPGYWDHRYVPPYLLNAVLGIDQIQGFLNGSQAPYQLSHIPSPNTRPLFPQVGFSTAHVGNAVCYNVSFISLRIESFVLFHR